MPDITVQFELGNEGTMAQGAISRINAAIDQIVNGIHDKPLYLKFDISPDSLSGIESKLRSIADEFSMTLQGSGITRALDDARRLSNETSKQKQSITSAEAKKLAQEQKEAAKAQADAAKEQARAEREAQKEAEKAAKAKEKAAKAQQQAAQKAAKEQQRAQERAAKQAEREAEKQRQREEREAEKAQRDAATAENNRKRQIERITKAQADIDELGRSFNGKSFAKADLEQLGALSNRLKEIDKDLRNNEGSLGLERSKNLGAEISNITSRISALRTELNTLNKLSQESFLTNPKAQGDAMQEISKKLTTAQNSLRNYTAATKSSSEAVRDAYSNIEKLASEYEDLHNQVESGGISRSDYQKKIAGLNAGLSENIRIIKEGGAAHKTFGDALTSTMSKFTQYFSATRIVMAAYRSMKQMAKSAIEVDDAMAQLQIVTKSSNKEMAVYGQTAFDTAKKLGGSVTDVISATTTYARLGYSLKESGTLAELTTMLQGVGDIDASSAQNAVTAIIKAFDDIDVGNISSVMDKLVEVGNGAPISVSELAEGLNNASSALSAAGNNFDQSVALLTAANTTIQDAAKASTGLRTIAARIRNTKTELDALGETLTKAEYDEIVQQLTNITLADGTKTKVSLTDANGELRNTYDIVSDIAEVWDQMSANQQAALAETLAGTRQQNIFYSLVQNFDEATNAMDLMANSTGKLQAAYDIYLQTTTAHINQFKTAFSELGTDIFDTGAMNMFIDFGTMLLNITDKAVDVSKVFGAIGPVLMAFAGAKTISGIKSFA